MSKDIQRLFIALNLPTEIKDDLSDLLECLSRKSKGIKWVAPEALHLTLKFLGSITNEQKLQIEKKLHELSSQGRSLTFRLGDINTFPNLSRPRVIYIECLETDSNHIFGLQRKIADKMRTLEFEPEKREWKPHITLGRVKSPDNKLPPINKAKYFQREFRVDTFDLMSSVLKREGPEHSIERKFKI